MNEQETVERDEVRRQNSDELQRLLAQYPSIYIPKQELDKWRPTVPTSGWIDGLFHLGNLTCICTDGVLAWFTTELASPMQVFFGHVDNFHWHEEVVSFVPYRKEDGTTGFFKSVKDHGAPAAAFKLPPKARELREKKKKLTLYERALSLLRW